MLAASQRVAPGRLPCLGQSHTRNGRVRIEATHECCAGSIALDRDEGSDWRVGPDCGGSVEREFDAAEALWCSERGAVERVQRVAAVEVADAGVVVVRFIGVGAAHPTDRHVLEDWPGPECGR